MGERKVFSTNGAGKIGYPYGKGWIWTPISYHIQKLTQDRPVLNVTAKTITLLEKNIGVNLHDLGFSNRFIDSCFWYHTIIEEIDKLDFIKI